MAVALRQSVKESSAVNNGDVDFDGALRHEKILGCFRHFNMRETVAMRNDGEQRASDPKRGVFSLEGCCEPEHGS